MTRKKVITNKGLTVVLVIDNVTFTQQCFVLPITGTIILGSDLLEIYFAMLDIGDCTITLHCAFHMLTTSLTHDPVHDYHLAKIVALATTEIL